MSLLIKVHDLVRPLNYPWSFLFDSNFKGKIKQTDSHKLLEELINFNPIIK